MKLALRAAPWSLVVAVTLTGCPRAPASVAKPAPPPSTVAAPAVPAASVAAVPVELVATNDAAFCVRMSDGTARCWGNNRFLQLGSGRLVDASRAGPVLELAGSKRLIAGAHSVCSLSDGQLSCWGGQIPNPDAYHPATRKPALVAKQVTDVAFAGRAVCTKAGGDWSCLHPQTGKGDPPIVEWVSDAAKLRLPMTSGVSRRPEWAPLAPDGYGSNYSACGIDDQGGVQCVGSNLDGALGNGKDGGLESAFVSAVGLTDVIQVTEASLRVCALRKAGTIACWGMNYGGALGFAPDAKVCSENHASCTRLPTTVPGLSDVVEITRPEPLCARRANGEVHCLAFRDGSTAFHRVELPAAARQLSTSLLTTCALLADDTVRCWGDDRHGQTGRGRLLASKTAVKVPELHDVVDLDATSYGVFLRKEGSVGLWGAERPPKPVKLTKVAKVAGRCALHTDGTVSCWGNNADSLLGDGKQLRPPNEDESDPRKVPGLAAVTQLASPHGAGAACALDKAGVVRCWGDNLFAMVPGFPFMGPLPKVVKVEGLPKIREVAVGMALDEAGGVWSWDHEHRKKKNAPVKLTGVPPVLHLSHHAPRQGSRWGAGGRGCFVLTDGRVYCDGPNPVVEGLTDVVALAADARPEGCALRKDGVVRCWTYAEGTPLARDVVTDLLTDVDRIIGSTAGYCALRRDGSVWCWGSNETGLIGPDMSLHDAPPAAVVGL